MNSKLALLIALLAISPAAWAVSQSGVLPDDWYERFVPEFGRSADIAEHTPAADVGKDTQVVLASPPKTDVSSIQPEAEAASDSQPDVEAKANLPSQTSATANQEALKADKKSILKDWERASPTIVPVEEPESRKKVVLFDNKNSATLGAEAGADASGGSTAQPVKAKRTAKTELARQMDELEALVVSAKKAAPKKDATKDVSVQTAVEPKPAIKTAAPKVQDEVAVAAATSGSSEAPEPQVDVSSDNSGPALPEPVETQAVDVVPDTPQEDTTAEAKVASDTLPATQLALNESVEPTPTANKTKTNQPAVVEENNTAPVTNDSEVASTPSSSASTEAQEVDVASLSAERNDEASVNSQDTDTAPDGLPTKHIASNDSSEPIEKTVASAEKPVAIPVPVQFVYRKAIFTPSGDEAANLLLEYVLVKQPTSVTLSGHADERASEGYNMELSSRRLQLVADFLRKGGYQGKLVLVPLGESQPYLGVDRSQYPLEELYQLDRRVELHLGGFRYGKIDATAASGG